MASTDVEQSTNDRWRRAVVGPLSPDFLRISTPRDLQEAADRQAAFAIYQQQALQSSTFMAPNIIGRLSITIAQAKLVRNYGLTRMDPYVRVRIGHFVYETQTDPNGGKNPRWNRVIHSQLPTGVNSMYIEIYDECSFKMDELIAWVEIKIPDSVLRGETHEDWFPLSGKQGDGVEGMLDVVMSFANAGAVHSFSYAPIGEPTVLPPHLSGRPMPVFVQPQPLPLVAPSVVQQAQPNVQLQQQPPATQLDPHTVEQDLKHLEEMFPNIDKEVIKTVYEENRGNKDTTSNALLQLIYD